MRVFVTGGTGFIGANLVEALNERDIVPVVLMRESSSTELLEGLDYTVRIGDILDDPQSLAQAIQGCDWVFHAAALSDYRWQESDLIYQVNVQGTKNVVEASREAGVKRFVFTSSLSAFGLPEKEGVMDEQHQFNLEPSRFPYGHSKFLAEIEVRKALDEGLQSVIVNPTGVVGPRGIYQTVGALFSEARKGRLRFYPSGGLNIVDVGDVVMGHIAAAERGRVGENYILAGDNLLYKEMITIGCEVVGQKPPIGEIPGWLLPPLATLVDSLQRVIGDRIPLEANQLRLAGRKIYADGGKAVRELGVPQTPFRVAIQQAYDWYLDSGFA